METAKYLWIIGSAIITILGIIHLYYTFFTNKFSSKNENLISEMKTSSPNLTKETTIWKAWIGFNASHSSGAMFIGIINIFLALEYFNTLQSSHFYFLFNIATVLFYVWLAKKYWFKIPFVGLLVSILCYVLAYVVVLVN